MTATNFINRSLSPEEFLSTFSYREVLTALTLSLGCTAGISIIQYYSDERFVQHWNLTFVLTNVIVTFLANHIFYRFEHGRSNNLMGRVLFDIMFLICIYLIKSTYLSIIRQSNQFFSKGNDLGDIIGVFFGVIILVFVFEFLVSLLKYFLKWVRCPVL